MRTREKFNNPCDPKADGTLSLTTDHDNPHYTCLRLQIFSFVGVIHTAILGFEGVIIIGKKWSLGIERFAATKDRPDATSTKNRANGNFAPCCNTRANVAETAPTCFVCCKTLRFCDIEGSLCGSDKLGQRDYPTHAKKPRSPKRIKHHHGTLGTLIEA